METYENLMEDLFGKSYDIGKALEDRGFILDYDGDRRTTYLYNALSVSIFWDGDILTDQGIPDGFIIRYLNNRQEKFTGHKPKNDQELDLILLKMGFKKQVL